MIFEKSCGAVVFTRVCGEIKYLLVTNLQGETGFPKGHVEDNETEKETALREVFEETKLNIRFVGDFRETAHVIIRGDEDISKEIVFFLGFFENQDIAFQKEELSRVHLASFCEAKKLLGTGRFGEILKAADEYLAGK